MEVVSSKQTEGSTVASPTVQLSSLVLTPNPPHVTEHWSQGDALTTIEKYGN